MTDEREPNGLAMPRPVHPDPWAEPEPLVRFFETDNRRELRCARALGEACEQAQLTGADYKPAEGRVLAAFDALQAEATISYEALERQREATKAAEREVEALRTERDGLKVILFDARQTVLTEGQRALAAEAALAEAVGALTKLEREATVHGNSNGCSGDLYIALYDARSTLSRLAAKETK
jgi:hypothetical protein